MAVFKLIGFAYIRSRPKHMAVGLSPVFLGGKHRRTAGTTAPTGLATRLLISRVVSGKARRGDQGGYILRWSELSRRKLSPTLATPTTLVLTTLVARCELSRRKMGLLLEVVGNFHTDLATLPQLEW